MTEPLNPPPADPAPYVVPAATFTALTAEVAALPLEDNKFDRYGPKRPTVLSDYRAPFGDGTRCLAIKSAPNYIAYTTWLLANALLATTKPTVADLDAVMTELHTRQHVWTDGNNTYVYYPSVAVADPTTDPGLTAVTLTFTNNAPGRPAAPAPVQHNPAAAVGGIDIAAGGADSVALAGPDGP